MHWAQNQADTYLSPDHVIFQMFDFKQIIIQSFLARHFMCFEADPIMRNGNIMIKRCPQKKKRV